MTYQKPLEEKARFDLVQEGKTVTSGDIYKVREWIEEQLENKLGFFVSLQENFEVDEGYQVYVHTDTYEDLEEEDLTILANLNIKDDPEGCTEVLSNFLGYTVQFTHFEDDEKKVENIII